MKLLMAIILSTFLMVSCAHIPDFSYTDSEKEISVEKSGDEYCGEKGEKKACVKLPPKKDKE